MKKAATQSRGASFDKIWTVSNMLSMFRMLLAIPLAFVLQDAERMLPFVLVLSAVAYASDLLDGWVARTFDGESRFGRIIDPLADKVFITVGVLGMEAAGLIPWWFTILVIARDIIILAGGVHLRARTGQVVQSTMLGKATVVSIGVALIAALFGEGSSHPLPVLLLLLAVGMIAASLYGYGQRYVSLIGRKK